MSLTRRVAFTLLSSFVVVGCATTPATDPNYKPSRGAEWQRRDVDPHAPRTG